MSLGDIILLTSPRAFLSPNHSTVHNTYTPQVVTRTSENGRTNNQDFNVCVAHQNQRSAAMACGTGDLVVNENEELMRFKSVRIVALLVSRTMFVWPRVRDDPPS